MVSARQQQRRQRKTLGKAQRANKKARVGAIDAKIQNCRENPLHKLKNKIKKIVENADTKNLKRNKA